MSFLLFFFFLCLFQPSFADVESRKTPPQFMTISLPNPPPPSPPPPPPPPPPNYVNASSPFKPSIAIIIGILTAMFSVTLLMLLYVKHCKRARTVVFNGFHGDSLTRGGGVPISGRKNSGIDRAVIESLPIFRFSSLRGQKDGLECAVCLMKFEPTEVLRLLPKCKHAFHVECVDTWLDAHSTCPLCRYRVDPEDILLIDHETCNLLHGNHLQPRSEDSESLHVENGTADTDSEAYHRISGRHSSAGEKASHFLSQIVSQRPSGGSERVPSRFSGGPTSFARRSLDSFSLKKKSSCYNNNNNNESVAVGCFDRYQSHQRKDGLLLLNNTIGDGDGDSHRGSKRTSMVTGVGVGCGAGMDKTRFEHRIIISGGGYHQRWSDVQPSDLLYLRSEMIMFDNQRLSSVSGPRPSAGRRQMMIDRVIGEEGDGGEWGSGRSVINCRSVSEMTGLDRFSSSESNNSRHHRERRAGLVSRWLAWISSQSQPVVRSDRTITPPAVTVV